MFDLSKITETIGGLISGAQQQSPVEVGSIADLLNTAGIDPAMLDGLNQDEILNLLQQYGIDPSQLDVSQLSELLQSTGVGNGLVEMATSWLNTRGS